MLTQKAPCECARFAGRLQALDIEPLQVGIIGRLTGIVLITTGSGRMLCPLVDSDQCCRTGRAPLVSCLLGRLLPTATPDDSGGCVRLQFV